jgi:hypothetical protein
MDHPAIESAADSAIIETVTGGMVVTLADASAIREALLAAVARSSLPESPTLLALTEPLPAWIDPAGQVMIAGWLLQMGNGGLVLRYRLTEAEDAILGFKAPVAPGAEGWRVDDIAREHVIRQRRR